LWQIGTLPPGLHYDEAADTIIAQQIARGESSSLFIEAYTGKEVLFFYWAALWMKLIGPSVFAMRLAAALLGVLTVAVTYWTVRELFALPLPTRETGRWSGRRPLATVFIATSFWHVLMSRLGFRSIGEPFRGAGTGRALPGIALSDLNSSGAACPPIRRRVPRGAFEPPRHPTLYLNRWGWIIAGGALIGLNLYTYLAARLFPVAIAAIFFFLIVFDRGQRRLRAMQFMVVAVTALIVFAPLGGYFLNHPASFLTRIEQVAPRGDQITAVLGNFGQALGMFFLSGDPYIRFNLPYRPIFSFMWGVLFVIGLMVAAIGMFRGRTIGRKTAYFSVIAVTFIMLLPTALAVNEITPSNLRAIGMMPLVFVFPALGAWWAIQRIWTLTLAPPATPHLHPLCGRSAVYPPQSGGGALGGASVHAVRRRSVFLPAVFSVVLIAAAAETGAVYFGQYVHEPAQLYVQSDGDLADITRWLATHHTDGVPVYLAALHYRHPTVAALSENFDEVKWIAGNRGIVLPNGPGYLFFARLGLPDEAWLVESSARCRADR
jgi:hypothetical protein